jgi:hypothetical protein
MGMVGRARPEAYLNLVLAIASPTMVLFMVMVAAGVVWDQIRLMPSPRPSRAELARARPLALADWREVQARVAERQRRDGLQPEFGEVWTIRTGRICGVVNGKAAGIDYMTRFYADDRRPVMREDGREAYRDWWMECLDTRWVRLHAGTEKTGFCASKRGRESALGRLECNNGDDWPVPPTHN